MKKTGSEISDPHRKNAKASEGGDISMHLAETAWRVAVPFFVLSLGGIKLDELLGAEPMFTVAGVFAALAAVTVVVYRYVEQHFPGTIKRRRS